MKSLNLLILISACLIFSCKPDGGNTIPEDLEGKKEFLATKKSELRELQATIDQVSEEILKLDPPKEKPAIDVNSMIIQPQEFKRYIKAEARIVGDDIVNVSSEIGGRITSLNVKEGQYVQRGQLIATTDMETMERQRTEIETSLSLATTVYERQKRLWDQNIGSELQYLEAKNNKERLEKSLETLASQTKKKNVYAPISGVVDREFMKQGETAGPGSPIIQILNTNKVKVVVDLQESLLGAIKKGDYVDIYFPALDLEIRERVTLIGRTIDPANRTFKAEINCNSRKGTLKPNLLAEVRVNDFTQEDAIIVPLEVIQEEVGGQKYVYAIKKEGGKNLVHKSYVTLGAAATNEVVISSGVDAGDEIVIKGYKDLSEGSKVNSIPLTESTDE